MCSCARHSSFLRGYIAPGGLGRGKNIRKRGGNLLKNKIGSYIVPATALRKKNFETRLLGDCGRIKDILFKKELIWLVAGGRRARLI